MKKEFFDASSEDFYKWDKESFIHKKIESERNLDWYKHRYKRNLTISLIFAILTTFSTIGSCYIFKEKNENIKTYITTISGVVLEFTPTEKQSKDLDKAIDVIRGRQ